MATTRIDEKPVEETKASAVEILPGFQNETVPSSDLCIVLHGYGRVAPTEVHYIDGYKVVGGVCRNVPRTIADHWKKGTRPDGKPCVSRVYPQAILSQGVENEDVEFAKATGVQPLSAAKLAAMINATDAAQLAAALGRQASVRLAEQLLERATARH